MENVEKVVKAPSNPMSAPERHSRAMRLLSTRKTNKNPINKDPTVFTMSVPKGKPRPNRLYTLVETQNRNRAPRAPPVAINNN